MEFSFETAQCNPAKIRTRTGKTVIVNSWNVGGPFPIIATIQGPEPVTMAYDKKGTASSGDPRMNLILDVPEPKKKTPVDFFAEDFNRIARESGVYNICLKAHNTEALKRMEKELSKKIVAPVQGRTVMVFPAYRVSEEE